MNAQLNESVEKYLQHVRELYDSVQDWLKSTKMHAEELGSVDLNEEAYGEYSAPILRISTQEDQQLAEVKPVGADILAAEGRVDIVGVIDSQILVFIRDGGPQLSISTTVGEQDPTYNRRPLYQGVVMDGWYWINRNEPGHVRMVDRQVFLDLIQEVSDHDL
jgi:hypothetical protein